MKTNWDFIEKYFPNYDSNQLVAETLDLLKIVDGEAQEGDDAWEKLSEIKSKLNDFFGGHLTPEEINTDALNEIIEELNNNLVSLLDSAIKNFHIINPTYQKDIAIATAYFVSELENNSSFFNVIDKAYELAIKFVDKYPPGTEWGIEKNLEYEETLHKFLTNI